jgi:hypothetical protein
MPAPIIPWQPSNIPGEIQAELNRRKINRSFRYVDQQQGGWDNTVDGDWKKYRGPMVSWIRVCSNSAGHPLVTGSYGTNKERFILYSGKGFYQSYGFQPSSTAGGSNYQVIGYTPGNYTSVGPGQPSEPHIIENSLIQPSDEPTNYPIHVPPPEISRMEVTVQKELYRRAQIEWVCFSWKQLVYMTPYFLVPGITCMIEWGWNHYNIQSLVNLGDKKLMRELWDNAYPLYTNNILKSNGNYDVVYGIVTNFNWSVEGNKIICTTEITSKDRLYSGIAKDYGLTVDDKKSKTKNGLFQSLKDFIDNKDTMKNLRDLVTVSPVISTSLLSKDVKNQNNGMWYDILNPLLQLPSLNQSNGTTVTQETQQAQRAIRSSYVFGLFSGRPSDAYDKGEKFGSPKANDFDFGPKSTPDANKLWINMGMITAILNYFSALDSGAKNGENMFEVDIQNCVIGGHANLISCDPRVLIPNYKAPKFLYGLVGLKNNTDGTPPSPKFPYSYQVVNPLSAKSIQDKRLKDMLLQPGNACYRDNLDSIINYNRYRWAKVANDTYQKSPINSYSFPSHGLDNVVLPISPRGLAGNQLETDVSGLLSNIYISYGLLKEAVGDESNVSYTDIYKHILQVLMSAADGFWDLALTEVDGVLTISDKKFVGKYALKQQNDIVYSFDYYDADSIIKALKFRPVLSDAQATRAIYGEVNNANSKYKYLDKNDVLDYKFRDAVIGTPENKAQGDSQGDLDKRQTAQGQQMDLLSNVQTINAQNDDGTLQMSLNPYRQGSKPYTLDKNGKVVVVPNDMPEIIKLVMPYPQLLRLLINDGDFDNNPRYCAVQPGIILELTIQGIGGLRTFQYFTVKNLPEPYSDRNIIFRITDVIQTLEAGGWECVIRAQPLPLRGYIKSRLKGPYTNTANGWLPDPPT